MTPETRTELMLEYMEGEVPDDLLCAKYKITREQFDIIVHIGFGNIIVPEPLVRKLKRGIRGSMTIAKLAADNLSPEDMAISPLDSSEILEPEERNAALYLNDAELSFANNVLRGMNATAAAAASFEIFNKHMADKKAAELLRASHVAEYLSVMKGRNLFAPTRNKGYLEAVLWQVIDRSLELKQRYDILGQPVEGRCDYNPKALTAAAVLLAKMKGWDGASRDDMGAETQKDRLRKLQSQFLENKNNEQS